jgi:hypothetical protein
LEDDTVELLYHYVGTFDLHIESEEFALCSTFPRRRFSDRKQTLREAGLAPAGMLTVEEVSKQ